MRRHRRGNEFEAYRLTPSTFFQWRCFTCRAKVQIDSDDVARNDPNGFYHGMAVKRGGMGSVLIGPPSLFLADPESESPLPAQLDLFGCEVPP